MKTAAPKRATRPLYAYKGPFRLTDTKLFIEDVYFNIRQPKSAK